MQVVPKIFEVSAEDLHKFPNHLVLDGSEVDIQILPEELKDWDQINYTKRKDIVSFIVGTMKNEYCQLISSSPVVNPLNTGLGAPQFAIIPIDLTTPVNPNEQFLSIDDPAHPVFIGLLLNTYTEERTLKSVRIIPRISIDGINPTLNPGGQLVNKVPVPQLYQIYGTHDNIEATTHKDPEKLSWEAITNPTRMSSSDWTFATPTDLIFNKKNYDQLKYKGFKFVVREWNYDNASKIDRFPGFYRIEFNFLEDSEKWVLPNIPATEGCISIINLDDPLSSIEPFRFINEEDQLVESESIPTLDETIQEFQDTEIDLELSEKFAEVLEISSSDKVIIVDSSTIDPVVEELIQKVEKLQSEVDTLTTALTTQKEEFSKSITKLTKEKKITKSTKTEVPDEISDQIKELVTKAIADIEQVSKRNVSEINSVAAKQVSRLVEINEENAEELNTDFVTKDQWADKIAELTSIIDEKCHNLNPADIQHDDINLEEYQIQLDIINQQIVELLQLKTDFLNIEKSKRFVEITAEQININSNKLVEEQRELIEESKLHMGNTFGNLQRYVDNAIDKIKLQQVNTQTYTPVVMPVNMDLESSEIIQGLRAGIQKIQIELDGLTDDTSIVNVTNFRRLNLDQQSCTIKHWCIFGDTNGQSECTVALPSKPEDSQVITIQNFRDDNGHVDIAAVHPLSIIYGNKQLADRKSLGLTAKMEKLNVIFYNGRWHGELTDGLINQE